MIGFEEFMDDVFHGVACVLKAEALGLEPGNSYKMSLTFTLCNIVKRLEMDQDEGNIAIHKCLYALGMDVNEVPEYLKEREG